MRAHVYRLGPNSGGGWLPLPFGLGRLSWTVSRGALGAGLNLAWARRER